jgi:hypothetical protein
MPNLLFAIWLSIYDAIIRQELSTNHETCSPAGRGFARRSIFGSVAKIAVQVISL